MIHKRRGRIEIMIDILSKASRSINKNRLVFGANLNFKMAEKYLPLLIKRGLIVRVDGEQGVLYKITEKGREVLRDFKRIMGSA